MCSHRQYSNQACAPTLTWYHAGDLGEEAFDSPDGNTSRFLILYSCNDVFNLWGGQRESVLKVQ